MVAERSDTAAPEIVDRAFVKGRAGAKSPVPFYAYLEPAEECGLRQRMVRHTHHERMEMELAQALPSQIQMVDKPIHIETHYQ